LNAIKFVDPFNEPHADRLSCELRACTVLAAIDRDSVALKKSVALKNSRTTSAKTATLGM
jgi:hypothetical protein